MEVEFYNAENIPEEVRLWWMATIRQQDRIGTLLRSPEWFKMMADAAGQPGTPSLHHSSTPASRVLVGKERDACKLVLPMMLRDQKLSIGIAGKKIAEKKVKLAAVCGGDLIEEGASESDAAEIVAWCFREIPGLDIIWFNHVASRDRHDLLNGAVSESADAFIVRACSAMPHYRMKLPESVDDILARRSSKSWKKLKGRERALVRDVGSDVELVEVRMLEDCKRFGDQIVGLFRKTWQAKELGQGFSMDELLLPAERGWLRTFLLVMKDKITACAVCYQDDNTLIYEKIGFDPDFAKYSPGTILLYRIIERLYEKDTPQYLDFGEGEAEYKRQLADDVINVDRLMIVRNRPDLRRWFFWRRVCRQVNLLGKRLLKNKS